MLVGLGICFLSDADRPKKKRKTSTGKKRGGRGSTKRALDEGLTEDEEDEEEGAEEEEEDEVEEVSVSIPTHTWRVRGGMWPYG